ncbi:heme-binding protein [Pelagibacteraceae bacterium]|nr:heme-binding protein [Pelagibacteraceae bacterium]
MKKLLGILVSILFLSTNTTMASEEVKFDIVNKNEVYEIRKYSERLVAQAINDKDSGTFRKLFNYISGDNNSSKKIEMTTPVTQMKKNNISFMQFYLPSEFNKKTTPIPTNSDVEITLMKEGYFAVIRYSGRSSDKNFIKHTEILREKLLEDKILINGAAIEATYNPPWTLPLFRRNEVMFNIKWDG